MTCARDLLDSGAPECVGEHQTLHLAARPMRGLEVTAQLICADDDWLLGILTGQDTAVKCVAAGADPKTATAGDGFLSAGCGGLRQVMGDGYHPA